ncbi:YjbH domain-containing protein [Roseomonas sp. NAR14]|uniref:YjbH domain-containing protein n=1 Tax=Roseomonas acroporae TaxID=2937791 RepID=A0A9X1YFN5_9PROT|nr:YjbH domain-containing protein [Roseomonas acroporae]
MPATGSAYGGAGLIETRNARFRPDGTLEAGAALRRQRQFYFLNFQALPFLETTFRFAERLNGTTGRGTTNDRGLDLKLRLLRESDWLPALAVGMQDVIGTGIYGGEYVVASKRFGAFDLSLGWGWGRLGSAGDVRNPLGLASAWFDTRPRLVGEGGTLNTFPYFRGRATAPFAGVEWSAPAIPTPWGELDGLRVKLEWSGDRLRDERGGWPARTTGLRGVARARVNAGLAWQPNDWLDLGVSFVNGSDLLVRLSLRLDPDHPPEVPRRPPPEMPPRPESLVARPSAVAARPDAVPGAGAAGATAPGELVVGGWSVSGVAPERAVPDVGAFGTGRAAAGGPVGAVPGTPPGAPLRPGAGQPGLPGESPPAVAGGAPLPDASASSAVPDAAAPEAADTPDEEAVAARLFPALRAAGFVPLGLTLSGEEARIAVAGGRFRTLSQTASRVLRAAQPVLPAEVERIRLSWWRNGVEVAAILLPRAVMEAAATGQGSAEEVFAQSLLMPAGAEANWPWDGGGLGLPGEAVRPAGPRTSYGVEPRLRTQFGDPVRPLRWDVGIAVGGRLEFGAGLAVAGSVQQTLAGNLGDGQPSNSVLPHVRSDFARYAREGRTSIPALYGEGIWNLAPDWFARATVGYLEPMFAGASGEVLWRPYDRPFAVGLDLNYVAQREFAQRFGVQRYRVATGHLSLYWDLPWWNLYAVARAGRYLAGDWGGTIELGRRFDSGIEVGAFATFTNVPFSRFGEGSFDKGLYVRVPLDLLGAQTRAVATAAIRPVQRDGGQRLQVDNPLWELTRDGREDALRRSVGGFLR